MFSLFTGRGGGYGHEIAQGALRNVQPLKFCSALGWAYELD